MSDISIARYFPYKGVKVTRQSVSEDGKMSWVVLEPDERFTPTCWVCGEKASRIHQYTHRRIRDLCLCEAEVHLNVQYRKIECKKCDSIRVEHHDFVEPYARVTHRLGRYVYELCKHMSIRAVAKHVGLDWKTVKEIDKHFLEKEYGQTQWEGLRLLAIDEISIRRGHSYMTVVLNYLTGSVVWMSEGRSAETLDEFFREMPEHIREQIEAVAIDMWDPYIKAVHKWCPSAKIIFDLFHVVRAFGRVIDIVRIEETKKACKDDKDIFKGSKYLLLKNKENLKGRQRLRLRKLLSMNKTLSSMYILKDYLKKLWQYKNRTSAQKFLLMWCRLAYETPAPALHKFAKMLIRYRDGILDHCLYPINTSVLEGCNNKIKSIARRAFGFHDNRYFALKVIQAFSVNN